jgi:hypothetical protein
MDLAQVADGIGALSGAAVLALVLVLMLRGDLVTRKSHESILGRCSEELGKVERDRDRWRDRTMESLNLLEAAVGRGES